MSSFVRIIHSVPDSAATMQAKLDIDDAATSYSPAAVESLFTSIVDGAQVSYTKVATGVIPAYGLVTFSSTGPVNDETMTVANITFTAKASASTDPADNEFTRSNTPGTDATNLAAAINASPDTVGLVTASAALSVVTITSVVPGVTGNGLDLAEAMTNTAVTAFAHGSDGKQVAVNYGAVS